jgi:methylase of polypeptide subunit release factors
MDARSKALIALGRALEETGYSFVTVCPETHRRVDARAGAAGRAEARTLRDAFGWSRAFEASALPATVVDLARAAGVLVEEGSRLRSTVRFSTLRGRLFVHSAYPTLAPDAVFFGPDTYRFADLIAGHAPSAKRVVDVGCGSGAGGIVASPRAERVVLADVNGAALAFAAVNSALARCEDKVELVTSDVLHGVEGAIVLVLANPPYMVDGAGRTYRDGGGSLGEGLAVRIAREALERLEPRGTLVLYTGAAIVGGTDTFLADVRGVCEERGAEWRYWEIEPDVFGDEIESNEAYAAVERIAAVALVATRR